MEIEQEFKPIIKLIAENSEITEDFTYEQFQTFYNFEVCEVLPVNDPIRILTEFVIDKHKKPLWLKNLEELMDYLLKNKDRFNFKRSGSVFIDILLKMIAEEQAELSQSDKMLYANDLLDSDSEIFTCFTCKHVGNIDDAYIVDGGETYCADCYIKELEEKVKKYENDSGNINEA